MGVPFSAPDMRETGALALWKNPVAQTMMSNTCFHTITLFQTLAQAPHSDIEPHSRTVTKHMTAHMLHLLQVSRETLDQCCVSVAILESFGSLDGLSNSTEGHSSLQALRDSYQNHAGAVAVVRTSLEETTNAMELWQGRWPADQASEMLRLQGALGPFIGKARVCGKMLKDCSLWATSQDWSVRADAVQAFSASRSFVDEVLELVTTVSGSHAMALIGPLRDAAELAQSMMEKSQADDMTETTSKSSLPLEAWTKELQAQVNQMDATDLSGPYLGNWLTAQGTTRSLMTRIYDECRSLKSTPLCGDRDAALLGATINAAKALVMSHAAATRSLAEVTLILNSLVCGLLKEGFCRPQDDPGAPRVGCVRYI